MWSAEKVDTLVGQIIEHKTQACTTRKNYNFLKKIVHYEFFCSVFLE